MTTLSPGAPVMEPTAIAPVYGGVPEADAQSAKTIAASVKDRNVRVMGINPFLYISLYAIGTSTPASIVYFHFSIHIVQTPCP